MVFRSVRSAVALAALVITAGCTPAAQTDQASAPAASPAATVPAAESTGALPLPVPVNAVMVALVDFAADGIWRPAASETPLTDKQWLLAEQDAINLIASASLITMAGTGVNDAQWVAEPDWRRWATDMQVTAEQAKAAVDAKDQARLKLVGDRLVEICQTCHQKYKPGLPSMGITRFPIYPKRDGTLTPP
jgi:hypothetical protein